MTDGVVDLKRQHLVTGIKQDAMEKYLFAVINKTGHARKVIRLDAHGGLDLNTDNLAVTSF